MAARRVVFDHVVGRADWRAVGISGGGLGSGVPLVVWFPNRCLTNPNQAFNTAFHTREWQAKVSGAYQPLPYGILASANYDIRSGAPQARQVLFTGGQSIRSISLNVEPIGSIFLPNTHELDVRLAKRVSLGGGRSLELRGDIYNALNKGTVRGAKSAVGRQLPAPQPDHVPADSADRHHVHVLTT